MPYFALPYSKVIEDTSGHIVRFVANTPTYVPPVQSLIDKVQMFGGAEAKEPAAEVIAAEGTGAEGTGAEAPADKPAAPATAAATAKKPRPAARG